MNNKLAFLVLLLVVYSCNDYLGQDPRSTRNDGVALDHSINDTVFAQKGFILDTLPNGIVLKKIDSLYIWQDDMAFLEKDLSLLCPSRSANIAVPSLYWPGGRVYYTYHSSLFPNDIAKCQTAMDSIMANTSITFLPKEANTTNYIEFVDYSSTLSQVGMVGGRQYVLLEFPYVTSGNIMHELLHTLGLFHEHTRSDRDNYVTIHYENIMPGYESNFAIFNGYTNGINYGSFDFNSIMMYPYNAFPKYSGLTTIERKDGLSYTAQRDSLSTGDKVGIAAVYGPPYHRLKSSYTILEEVVYGSTDKLICSNTDSLVFYADKACTVRAPLQYPREILVKSTRKTANWNNWNYYFTYSYWTVTIPAGTTAYCLKEWIDTEWYEYSNPYNIDITTNEIVNYLVP